MPKINEHSKGVFMISVTPFAEEGGIDYHSADTLVEFYLESGIHGLTLLGMMGEAHKLSLQESFDFASHVLRRVADRVPVIVGVSNNALTDMRSLTMKVMEAGAAGVMVAPMAGLRGDDQILAYFASVCETLGPEVPLVYQDYPQSTGVYLSSTNFLRLSQSFAQIVMLKHEDCPGLGKLSRIRQEMEKEGMRRVSIMVGNGALYYPQELRRGADGAMTGFAFPEMLVGVFRRFSSGDDQGAEDLYDLYLPLVRYEQQPGYGLAVRKEILRRRGAIASAKVRAPSLALTRDDLAELDSLMARLERKLDNYPFA